MAKPGVLWEETQGMSMRDRARWRRRFVEEKGCYCEALTLKEADPVTFEVLYAKLVQSVVNARELGKLISASTAIRELGEITMALYTPEGDCVCLSCGVLLHVHSLSWFIKFMLEEGYEENPGIRPGDIFMNNDPHIGGFHAPDILIAMPIFHQGRLVAWAGGMSHVPEIGAVEPGGLPASSTSRFQEGLFFSAVKIGENDVLRRDIEVTIERSVRDPAQWLLDNRAKVAGTRHIRATALRLIDEYGAGYFTEALQEYIEDSRRAAKAKLRRIVVPGRYRARGFQDGEIPGSHAALMQITAEMTIDGDGQVTLDFEGTSPEEPLPLNSTLPATDGAIFANLVQFLFYDCHFNDGSTYAFTLRLREPSLLKCGPFASTVGTPGRTGGVTSGVLTSMFSRAYYMSGQLHEVIAPTPTSTVCYKGGFDQFGRRFGFNQFELVAMGTGARALMDGAHACYAPFNPEGDSGDAELWEREAPILYIGRRLRMDGGGFGKFRGGSALDSVLMIHGTPECQSGMVSLARWCAVNQGLMGGYPAPNVVFAVARRTNIDALIAARQPLVHTYGDPRAPELTRLQGEIDPGGPVNRPMSIRTEHDVEEVLFHAGAGFGDPLARDPELVRKDLLEEVTSRRAAEEIYGVIVEGDRLHPDVLRVNREATEARRKAIRQERLRRGRPAREYLRAERDRVLAGDLPPVPKRMINRLLGTSPRWAAWFRRKWNLPENFAQIP
jgi:acetone carboxylase alpha subunit